MQSPQSVVVIRPHFFTPNPQTSADNLFQKQAHLTADTTAKMAFDEVTTLVEKLRQKAVTVHLFDDETRLTPDSVFPNNWLVTLPTGEVMSFPMYAQNRRAERRNDIKDFLSRHYAVSRQVTYEDFEAEQVFLEGTGSMILDHQHKVAYAAISNRTHPPLLQHFCDIHGFEMMAFDATDGSGTPIYHTNVMMSVGEDFAVIAADQIKDKTQKRRVLSRLESTCKEVIEISEQQVNHFCGNVLQLRSANGQSLLAMSQTASEHFTDTQKQVLSQYAELLPMSVPTIELAGGSVRCMLAGIHLPAK